MSAVTMTLPVDLTVAEFLEWCPEDGQRWQLVDGEPVAMAPPSPTHAFIHSEIARLIGNHLERAPGACRVATGAGVVPHARAGGNLRIPDLAVTCTPAAANDAALREPVLLVEVLSRRNARDTRANVWAYTSIPSVREIIVVHADRRRVELLRREPDGTWPPDPVLLEEGELVLESIGFRVAAEALYRTAGL